jgi:hypothetical protein
MMMNSVVSCAKCGVPVGRLRRFCFSVNGAEYEDCAFVPNSNFGGRCRSCGDMFCGHCCDLDAGGNCRECSKDGWDDTESFDYNPFYRAARAYANNKISKSLFMLEWKMAQKNAS